MTKSVTCQEELGGLASQVTVDYIHLAQQGRLAAATAEPEEVRITLEGQSVINRPMGWKEWSEVDRRRIYKCTQIILFPMQWSYKQEAQLAVLLKQIPTFHMEWVEQIICCLDIMP